MATKTKTASKSDGTRRSYTFDEKTIGAPVDSSKIKRAPRRINSNYVPLINSVLDLKVGKSLLLPVPSGTTLSKFRASVSAVLRKRLDGQLAKGVRLSFGATEDGKLLIEMVADKG